MYEIIKIISRKREMVDRVELLMSLYQRGLNWFRDTRRLNSISLMNDRLREIKAKVSSAPLRKRSNGDKDYRNLATAEQKMIKIKRAIYENKRRSKHSFELQWLEKSDVHTEVEENRLTSYERDLLSARQSLLLMSILYKDYDDNTLESFVARLNKLL